MPLNLASPGIVVREAVVVYRIMHNWISQNWSKAIHNSSKRTTYAHSLTPSWKKHLHDPVLTWYGVFV